MSDSDNALAAFGFILCANELNKLKRRRRRFKIRPINRARRTRGNFQYYLSMKEGDSQQFFKFTRMTTSVFDKLLNLIRARIERRRRTDGISPEERLVITLQYLSQGTSMQSLAWTFHVGLTTVHVIIHETCKVLWEILSPLYLKTPSTVEEWESIAEGFLNRWNFPHCIGAVDGKHINIQAPSKSGSLFYNYKMQFSIVLLAACDSRYAFTIVDIGAYGSQSDGGIFRHSVFGQKFENGEMGLPEPKRLPGSNIVSPYYLVADEAFPLKNFIMRPYPGRNVTEKQKIFNYRMSRARQIIENAFGILVARWRILKTTINAKVENVDNMVKAVVVLHNYCLEEMATAEGNTYCPPGFVDTEDEEGEWRNDVTGLAPAGRLGANVAKREAYKVRDELADYFVSEQGSVPWQGDIVNRGTIQ